MGLSFASDVRQLTPSRLWPDSASVSHAVCERASSWKYRSDKQLVAEATRLQATCSSLDMGRLSTPKTFTRGLKRSNYRTNNSRSRELIEVAALTFEACRRVTGFEPYEVQVQAGIVLSHGGIAEMATGEGKTLATLFPAVYHAVCGRPVHVATVNPYLAERDYRLLAPAIELLGFSAGFAAEGCDPSEKRSAYESHVTFATGYELGFDFLRDQLALRQNRRQKLGSRLQRQLDGKSADLATPIQRRHGVAIIDEVDSVLIDEATMPLILSAPPSQSHDVCVATYAAAHACAESLTVDRDFILDESKQVIDLTQEGMEAVNRYWKSTVGCETRQGPPATETTKSTRTGRSRYQLHTLLEPEDQLGIRSREVSTDDAAVQKSSHSVRLKRPWARYVQSALRAQHLLHRDQHYVVSNDRVLIVDEFTGRLFEDRNWRDGLHQAVEFNEGVTLTAESHSLAKISRQSYFQRYALLCGMTGTAQSCRTEFRQLYGLQVSPIPLRLASHRTELPCRYFRSLEDQIAAIVTDTVNRHFQSQPVLIGTRTIRRSHLLAEQFSTHGIQFQLLNGVQDEQEACIVAAAGKAGAVTVATNLAGRGTDIPLCSAACAAGGLHVIGCERNFSSRIDRQLLGRAGRQGQPGSGQFFVGPDDELLKRYHPSFARKLSCSKIPEVTPRKSMHQEVDKAQAAAEEAALRARRESQRQSLWIDGMREALH